MKHISKLFIISLLLSLVFSTNVMFGQGHDFEALKKEYPLLMKKYGNRLESRTAHYIFAIDISSSMQEYETVVRQSMATFIKAVPDGDQITLIAMSDENNTNYVNSIKCITINPQVRQSIVQTITSSQFKFLRSGDKNDGSDGYTMTHKVLEAMNVVNSSDLTFVYLLTDFEYWTHKYKFDKTQEDWNGLKPLLTDKHKGMMCKYGIELNSSKVSHPEAIFKPELDNIFGPLDYQQANSAEILAQWFGHIINDIRAHKINAMLKADWKEYLDSISVNLQNNGQSLNAMICAPKFDLVSGATVTLTNGGDKHLEQAKDVPASVCDDNVWEANVGIYKTDKTWYPSFLKEDASDALLLVSFQSPYAEEITKLQSLCQETADSPNAISFKQDYPVNTPATKVWNSAIHWAWWLIIAIVLLALIVSTIYMLFQHPERRSLNVSVLRGASQNSEFVLNLPYTVGKGGQLDVPGAGWRIRLEAHRYHPAMIWKKTGCYVVLEDGLNAEIVDMLTNSTVTAVQQGDSALLFKHGSSCLAYVKIDEGSIISKIEITC